MKSLMEMLDPNGFTAQFNTVRVPEPALIPDPPARPDNADVLFLGNEALEEVRDSTIRAELDGPFRPMTY